MAKTESTMLPLGTPAPQFALPDPQGRTFSLDELRERAAVVVAFWCNHCPFVQHVREGFVQLANDYMGEGVGIVAINSNDFEAHPDDAPARMAEDARRFGYRFPYLVDADQSVARAFQAACTPDFFVFDVDRRLVYRGQMDDSRPGNGRPVTGADLRTALDAVLTGKPVPADQRPSIGCNIKWKPGREPQGSPA